MPDSEPDTLKCRNCGVNNGPCPDECKASHCLVTLTNPPLPEPDAEFLAYQAKDAGRYPPELHTQPVWDAASGCWISA